MKIASKFVADTIYGRIIKARAFNPLHPKARTYCHTELVFSDGAWFSAREFHNAVSFVPVCPDNPAWYDYIHLNIPSLKEYELREWCERQMHNEDGTPCGYDIKAIIFQFLPIPLNYQSEHDWFCTEIVCGGLKTLGYLPGYSECGMMPTTFHRLMEEQIKHGEDK